MLSVIVTILKIIGIILLAIIALLLIILALALFVPIRYRIKADKEVPEADFSFSAAITYLLHIVSVRFAYEGEIGYSVKVFGIKIRPKKEKETSEDDTGEEETAVIQGNDTVLEEENNNGDQENPDETESSGETELNVEAADTSVGAVTGEAEEQTDETKYESGDDESFVDRINALADRLILKYKGFEDKINGIRDRIIYINKMINDAGNRRAFELILGELKRFLKKIAPKKIKGFVHFGFEDPATTGKVLAYLAMIYPMLPRRFRIEPGWEDTDIYGTVDIKGRLALITVAVILIRLFFNKDCRRLWNLYKKRDRLS